MSASSLPLPSPLDLVEEAVHLLRRMDPGAWCIYAAGTFPFAAALFFCWMRVTTALFSPSELPFLALLLAALYVPMKVAHAMFCANLLARRAQSSPTPVGGRSLLRLSARVLRLHPWSLLAFWGGLGTVIPAAWAIAYSNGLSASLPGDEPRRRAGRLAGADPKHQMIGALLLALLFLVLLVNVYVACIVLPWLTTHLLGLHTLFSLDGLDYANRVYFAAAVILSWATFSPLAKAYFALHLFHQRSRISGEDLEAALRELSVLAAIAPAMAAPPRGPSLDQALDRVLARPEYRGLIPTDPVRPENRHNGPVATWLGQMGDQISRTWQKVENGWDTFWRWLKGGGDPGPLGGAGGGAAARPHEVAPLFYVAIAIALLALVLLIAANLRARGLSKARPLPPAPEPAADLNADQVDASLLPAPGWCALADECARRGDWRLALRAAYLATLAALADRQLLRIERAKTNLDYERELRRRASGQPAIVAGFARRRALFESVWYGRAEPAEADVRPWLVALARGELT